MVGHAAMLEAKYHFMEKGDVMTKARTLVIFAGLAVFIAQAPAQTLLFDFDNAPIHTALPIDLTAKESWPICQQPDRVFRFKPRIQWVLRR